jgi:ribosome-associated protein
MLHQLARDAIGPPAQVTPGESCNPPCGGHGHIVRTRYIRYTAIGGGLGGIEPTTLARILAEAASEAKAADVQVMDIHHLTVIADLFVICSADNERLLRAISRQIMEATDKIGLDPRRVEGSAEAGWILLDYADVVVHIFGEAERQFYRLEEVWAGAQTLLVIQ